MEGGVERSRAPLHPPLSTLHSGLALCAGGVEEEDRDDCSAIGIGVDLGDPEIAGIVDRRQINDDADDARAGRRKTLRDIAAGDVVLNILHAFVGVDGVVPIHQLGEVAINMGDAEEHRRRLGDADARKWRRH